VRSGHDSEKGLYRKFKVERTDGRSALGQKHEHCRYFVLDLDHDEFATAAMATYRAQCSAKFPELANDIGRYLRGEGMFDGFNREAK
jgi:hypothetical protein